MTFYFRTSNSESHESVGRSMGTPRADSGGVLFTNFRLWFFFSLSFFFSFFFSLFFLALNSSLAGNSGRLTWVRLQQPQEQRYPFLTVRSVFSCLHTRVWLRCVGFFLTCTQMLKHAIAHEGCTDTVRESALKVDSGRKIPCRTGESNLPQRRADPTLYQLSCIPAP